MIEATVRIRFNENISRQIMQNLDEAFNDIADAILTRSQELVPVSESTLIHSGHLEPSYLDKKVLYDAPHAAYIEFGTRPHFPPYDPIREWTWRNRGKLGIKEKEVDGVAYQICLKISKEGTEEQPYLRPAFDFVVPKIGEIIRDKMR